MKLEFSRLIFEKKNTVISNFVKIRFGGNRVVPVLTDGHSDVRDETNSRFRQRLPNALKDIRKLGSSIRCSNYVTSYRNYT